MSELQNRSGGLGTSEHVSTQARYVIAGVYALLAVLAISLNTPVLVTFIKDRTLRTPSNKLIISIMVGDWLHAVLAYPLGVVANTSPGSHGAFPRAGCVFYAFITTFLSFGIMLHHAAFAIERAIVIQNAVTSWNNVIKLNLVIAALWAFALLWTCFPLFGWSAYVPEGDSVLCSIHWQSPETRDIAFIFCIFFFFFFAPIVAMVTAYCKIFLTVKKMTQNAHDMWGKNAPPTQEAIQSEKKTARMAFVMSFCFLFAWTPYAIVSLYAVIRKSERIPSLVGILPALFAKTAACYNPVIYFLLFEKFRESLKKTMRAVFCGLFVGPESSTNIELNEKVLSSGNNNHNESVIGSGMSE